MSRIFISHSSANNAEAVALRDWLRREGFDDVFLDIDPEGGIAAGERWERALNEAAQRCEAVLFLVSRAWLDSGWCLKEFNLAHRLNKRLFGLLIEDIPTAGLPVNLTSTWQLVRLCAGTDHVMLRVVMPLTGQERHVTFSAQALSRLKTGLQRAGLDSRFFAWPPENDPERPPYRGLRPLEAEDAGIFFGRDAAIVEALDRLRGLRDAAPPRLLVVLGASGAGKSSFLRAGILPRLKRDDRNFLTLPVVRPGRAAITGDDGLIRSLEAAMQAQGIVHARADIRAAIEGGTVALRPLFSTLVQRISPPPQSDEPTPKLPVLVLPIDQGEELFLAEGAAEAEQLLTLLRDLLHVDDPGAVVVCTVRSDTYEQLQSAKVLDGIAQQTLSLPPIPKGSYQRVIEGPVARLRDTRRALTIEPALTQALLADIEAGGGRDALPLLAFTLERLYLEYGGRGRLTFADYQALGGIRGSIEAAVERALAAADADPRIPRDRAARLTLLRRGFIPWLAGIDPETASPRRRVARLSEIPAEARPLIQQLVEQRLLATDVAQDTSEVTIEPAHEALLRQWGLLQGWLEEDFGALTTLEGVKRAARDWTANARRDAWLTHSGGRLEEAERVRERTDLVHHFDPADLEYLAACWSREIGARVEAERQRAQRERLRRALLYGALAALVLVAAFAGFAGYQWIQTEQQRKYAEEREGEATRQRDRALLTQSRFLADLANQRTGEGDAGTAILLALEALLPDARGSARPYAPEAEVALLSGKQGLAEARILSGHGGRVISAAFSPDGHRVVTASDDHTARLWDVESGRQVGVLKGHSDRVWSAAFSPDGRRVVTASDDKTARLWEVESGRQVGVLNGHLDKVLSAAFSPDGRRVVTASGEHDGAAGLWDAETGSLIHMLVGHFGDARSATFSPDGQWVVTASSDKTARLWNVASGHEVRVFTGHEGDVNGASFSRDGRLLLTASNDKTARLWDVANGRELAAFRGHENTVDFAAFSPDGRRVVTTSFRTAYLWDVESGREIGRLGGHDSLVRSAVFSPDGRWLLTASGDGTARVWDVETGRALSVLRGHGIYGNQSSLNVSGVSSAMFSPDGQWVATASDDGTARLWNVAATVDTALKGHDGPVWSAAFNPDGRRVVTASTDKTVRLWDTATKREVGVLKGHEGSVYATAFSPDGQWIVSASEDRTARLWDAESGRGVAVLRGHDDKVVAAAFSPDGRLVVTGSHDNTARLWDAATGREVGSFNGHTGGILGVSFSPDGRLVLTASMDRTARLWDVKTGRQTGAFQGHEILVQSVAFSPDGRTVLTTSFTVARLWDVETGREIGRLKGYIGGWGNIAFSPDGKRVVAATHDATLLWDVESGDAVGVLKGHGGQVKSIALSSDGKRVVTASEDKTARLWDVFATTHDLIDRSRQAVQRCLTRKQREAVLVLDPEPPAWCIELEKWPYQSQAWKQWLADRKAGKQVEMPAEK